VDVERVDRADGRRGGRTESHTYTATKVYERSVLARPGGGLIVRLRVVSSTMQMDRTTVPRDLGGHTGEDWIGETGEPVPGHLGPVEDPVRPDFMLPALPVAPGDAWAQQGRAAGMPATHSVRVAGWTEVGRRRALVLESTSGANGAAAPSGRVPGSSVRVAWRQRARIHFDPVAGQVLRFEARSRLSERHGAPAAAAAAAPGLEVVRVSHRRAVLVPARTR
jgi:hypothetical protein